MNGHSQAVIDYFESLCCGAEMISVDGYRECSECSQQCECGFCETEEADGTPDIQT